MLFSVTEKESFEAIDELVESIHRIKVGEDVPIFIVGNKIDLQVSEDANCVFVRN